MEMILLYAIVLGCIAVSAYAIKTAHDAREYAESLTEQMIERFTALETSLPKTSDPYPIFDLLDAKIDQQAKRITNLGNKHNHLSNVVMEKIQKDWEAEHAETV